VQKIISLEGSIYSQDVILKAAYRLSNFFVIDLKKNDSTFEVNISAVPKITEEQFDYSLTMFKKNLTDEVLREKIKKETENERNLILGIAFSKTDFQDS
jgi:His-Xaa-Ser system protein HxsD